MIITLLYDIFVIFVLIYVMSLLYIHRHEILSRYESFKNIQPKHLEEPIKCSLQIDNSPEIKKYTTFKNAIPTNMFGNNDFYLTKNT